MEQKIKYLSIIDVKAANKEDRIVEFVATKEIRDYDGDIVKVDGMDISKIKKTKSFLWSHQQTAPPIGKIIRIWKDGKTIRGKAQMTSEEEYPFGYQIYKLIAGGYINNVSISFIPDYKTIEYKEDKKGNRTAVINNATMLEVSAVNIGANNATSIEAKSFRSNIEKAIEDKVVDKSTLDTYDEIVAETLSEDTESIIIEDEGHTKEEETDYTKLITELKAEMEELKGNDYIYELYDDYKSEEFEKNKVYKEMIDEIK